LKIPLNGVHELNFLFCNDDIKRRSRRFRMRIWSSFRIHASRLSWAQNANFTLDNRVTDRPPWGETYHTKGQQRLLAENSKSKNKSFRTIWILNSRAFGVPTVTYKILFPFVRLASDFTHRSRLRAHIDDSKGLNDFMRVRRRQSLDRTTTILSLGTKKMWSWRKI